MTDIMGTFKGTIHQLCALWGIITGFLLLSGCVLIQLDRDLNEYEKLGIIRGKVSTSTGTTERVVVALFRQDASGWKLFGADHMTAVLSEYSFILDAPEGFVIVAFDDINQNDLYDIGEPVGIQGLSNDLQLEPHDRKRMLDIELSIETVLSSVFVKQLQDVRLRGFELISIVAGEIVSLEDERFSADNAKEGMWAPLTSLRNAGLGVYMLEPYDPERIPVVFVHGIAGTPRDFTYLIEQLDRTRFQAWIYRYPSGMRLNRAGRSLALLLKYLHDEYQPDDIYVTAHSVGGLVSRSAILQAKQGAASELYESIKLFVSFSTPWNGHGGAAMGVEWSPVVVPAWLDIQPESDFLNELQAESDIPHHLFFGFATNGKMTMLYSHDSVVSVSSQLSLWIQNRSCRVYGYDLDHVGILNDEVVAENYYEILNNAYEGDPCK